MTQELIVKYTKMIRLGGGGGDRRGTISAMPQKIEYLARILESLACRRYSRVVSRKEKRKAVYLIRVATQTARLIIIQEREKSEKINVIVFIPPL